MNLVERRRSRPRPVQWRLDIPGGVFTPETPHPVCRFDVNTVIYPGEKRELGFTIHQHAILADRLGKKGRGGLSEYSSRESIIGRWSSSDSHDITLPEKTRFGAYARTAHLQGK